ADDGGVGQVDRGRLTEEGAAEGRPAVHGRRAAGCGVVGGGDIREGARTRNHDGGRPAESVAGRAGTVLAVAAGGPADGRVVREDAVGARDGGVVGLDCAAVPVAALGSARAALGDVAGEGNVVQVHAVGEAQRQGAAGAVAADAAGVVADGAVVLEG